MGKCGGPETKPYTFSLEDLQDLKVGEIKQMPRGCGPDIGGTQGGSGYDWLTKRGFGWPNNNEFEWGGLGDRCNMCSDIAGGYGCDCSGGESVTGKRGTVKRRAFEGDRTQCCLANAQGRDSAKIVDGKTCDFEFRDPSSGYCTNVFRDYCSVDNNLLNDDKCKSLEKSNATLYNELMKNYCNKNQNNALSNQCIDWCKSNSTECNLLNLQTDCAKYGLCPNNDFKKCGADCSRQNVIDIQSKCKRYGIESEQGMRIYGCTKSGIELIENECKELGVDLSVCSPIAIQDAKQNRIAQEQLRIQQEAKAQSQRNYQETQNTIAQVLGIPPPVNTTIDTVKSSLFMQPLGLTQNGRPTVEDEAKTQETQLPYVMIIVIILIILFLVSSSSSLGLILTQV